MVAQSILLLNASYEPLTVVTLARAVKLLLRGRAEAVSDEHITVTSAAQMVAVPQVLPPQSLRGEDLRARPASPHAGLDAPRRVRARRLHLRLLRPALRRARSHGGPPHTGIAGRGRHLGQYRRGLCALQSA